MGKETRGEDRERGRRQGNRENGRRIRNRDVEKEME